MSEIDRINIEIAKYLARLYLDIQSVRIALENRVRDMKSRGLDPGPLPILHQLLLQNEQKIARETRKIVRDIPIYREWLSKISGIGYVLAAQLIGEIRDIKRFKHVSNLYSYCGYGIKNGKIQRRVRGQEAKYHTLLKTIIHKIAVMIALNPRHKDPFYSYIYNYFKKLEEEKNIPREVQLEDAIGEILAEDIPKLNLKKGVKIKKEIYNKLKTAKINKVKIIYSPLHIHMRALRKVKKLFLSHLYEVWYRLEGIKPDIPYVIARGLDTYIPPPYIERNLSHDYPWIKINPELHPDNILSKNK